MVVMVIVVAVLMLLSVFYPLSSPQSTLYAQKGYAPFSRKRLQITQSACFSCFSSGSWGAPQGDTLEQLCLGGRRITPSLTCLGFPGPRGSSLSSQAKSGALALG